MQSYGSQNQELPESLGAERYRAFAVGYLIERGATIEAASQAVESYFASEKRRQEVREINRRKHAWQRSVLMKGLGQLRENAEAHDATVSSFWLSCSEVEELIRRCQFWKIEIYSITHACGAQPGENLTAKTKDFGSLEAAYASLRSQGCDEKFRVGVAKIPDEITEKATAPEKPEPSP